MRDQYAGDVSDVVKFALLRALAGADRTLGIAWYFAPGDDGRADGRHLEWRYEAAWRLLDAQLHAGLATLPERSIAALEQTAIWPTGHCFSASRCVERKAWAVRKRNALDGADIVFLDPDNGVGSETEKHATFTEIRLLRRPGRAIVFITFPGRSLTHDTLLRQLHERWQLRRMSRTSSRCERTYRCPALQDHAPMCSDSDGLQSLIPTPN